MAQTVISSRESGIGEGATEQRRELEDVARRRVQIDDRAGATRKRRRWRSMPGAGICLDIKARAPWYWSDWKDAWNYRVLPATALIFFAKCAVHYVGQHLSY